MDNNNGNNKKEPKIPIALIVFAYIVYWPVGILLSVLYLIDKWKNGGQSRQQQNQTSQQQSQTVKSSPKATYTPYQAPSYESYLAKSQKKQNQTTSKKEQIKKQKSPFRRSGLAVLLKIGGIFTAALTGITLLKALFHFNGLTSLIWPITFGLATAGMLLGEKAVNERDIRYARIRTMIGNRKSFNLTKLAAASGRSLKKIRRDVQNMINRGDFGETAYIDLGTNNFMRSPDAEPDEPEAFDYHTVYGNLFDKEKDKADEADGDTDGQSKSFGTILHEIRRLNDEIEDGPVSEKIDRIEGHTRNIFDYVTDHPETMPRIRTFMNYYLPTTLKLLESYSRIERVGVAGENMKKSKQDIEEILDMLVVGFEQQVDQLFSHETIDISSDIHVLEQMMQKDGLNGKNDFSSFGEGFGGAAAQEKPKDE